MVTLALAGLNLLVFLYGLATPLDGTTATALTLFQHASIAHLVFNVMFLWLFGDNVEDRIGRGGLVVCYLMSGALGTGVQAALGRSTDLPAVGASAAIAGIIGAYFVLLPRSKVLVLLPVPISLVEVPAVLFLAMFGLVQFLNYVVLPAAARLDSSPTAALAALALALGCGAALAASRRRPVIW